MIRPASALALAVLASAAATLSHADTRAVVSKAFGNTIVSTYQDGRKGYTWLKADGSYTGEGRRKDRSSGRWRIAGERLCFKQDHPYVFGAGFCVAVPQAGFENGFKSKSPTGEPTTITMVKGHVAS